jgi:hypothetical protein
MDEATRKLRGLVGIGATWGIAWAAIGALVGLVAAMLAPGSPSWGASIAEWAMGMGAYGFVSGVGFAGLLAYHERRSTIDDLSPSRAGVWGVLGAILVPTLFGLLGFFDADTTAIDVLEAMALTAVLGGSFAAGSVALARGDAPAAGAAPRALREDPERTLDAVRMDEPTPRATGARARERR